MVCLTVGLAFSKKVASIDDNCSGSQPTEVGDTTVYCQDDGNSIT
jgi:hypothetical protein